MLELKNISKVYSSKSRVLVYALKDVNLKFGDKGCNVILGPSGCGKSTLLNIIGGLDEPTTGNLVYNSYDIKSKDYDIWRNDTIGFIFQDFNLIPDLTIYENLSIVCYNKSDVERKQLIHDALLSVGLENYEERYSYEMSGGQIQRVAIARALLKNSKILLADEPTGNLNKEMSVEIFSLLKELSKEKLVIIVTHNDDLAQKYADRIIKFEDGVVISDSNPNIETSSAEAYSPKIANRLANKLVFKLSLKNLFSKKLRYFISLISLVLLFTLLSISFAIVNFDRSYVDAKNIQSNDLERFYIYGYNNDDTELNFITANEILTQNPNITYIVNDEIESYQELLNMGYELYEGYNEISYEGIYILDKYLLTSLHLGEILYDVEGEQVVEKDFPLEELVNKYYFFNGMYFKIDGIIKSGFNEFNNGTTHSDAENEEFYFKTHSYIFSKSNSLYKKAKVQRCIVSTSENHAYELSVNSKKINRSMEFSHMQNNYSIFDDKNIYKYENIPTASNNEIYLSLDLYNHFFNEFSDVEYYLGDNYHFNPILQRKPTHIGDTISFKFDFGNNKIVEIPDLKVKGIIYNGYQYSIYTSYDICEKIYDTSKEYQIMVKTSSVENLYAFISNNCEKYNITTYYSYTRAINNFEDGLLLARLICLIIFIVLLVITLLISINSINQTIKSKDKENGILRSIGITIKDIKKIYYYQLVLMITIPFILSIIFSLFGVLLVDYLIVYEYSTKIQLLFFKLWYVPLILLIITIFNVIISSFSLRGALNKNTIDIIRQN